MAVLESLSQNYYKIIFSECYIDSYSIGIKYVVYPSQEARNVEKEREQNYQNFLLQSNNELEKLSSSIQEGLSEETEETKKYSLIKQACNKIQNQLYGYEGLQDWTEEEKRCLIDLGAEEIWFTQKNSILGKILINLNNNSNINELTESDYYNLFKSIMNVDYILDV